MCKIYQNLEEIKNNLKDKEYAIFDFDGTIANTEVYHLKAYCICLKEIYNIELTTENFQKYLGHKEFDIYKMIEEDFNIKIDKDFFIEKRINVFLKLIKESKLEVNKFFNDFINKYNMKMYLLTSQKQEVVEELFKHWNLDKYFKNENRFYAFKGFKKSEVFENPLNFIKDQNFIKEKCVIFEDALDIIKTAQDSNYLVVSILHELNSHIIQNANIIIDQR